VTIDADLDAIAAGITTSSDLIEFTLEATTDREVAHKALRTIARRLKEVPHPDEPGTPFVSSVSRVVDEDGRARFSVGTSDLEAYPGLAERLAAAVIAATQEVPEADGVLAAGHPQRLRYVRPLRPDWFPLPPNATDWDEGTESIDDIEVLGGTVTGASFKCGVPLDATQLVTYYAEHLVPLGFDVSETRTEGSHKGLSVEALKASFVRGTQRISIETQALALTPETPDDVREAFANSPYARRTEVWIRLENVADGLDMVWDESQWRWVPPSTDD
jgi:hypothetical protein